VLAVAVADGIVNEATCTPKIAPLGCTVLIGHPGGYISRYAHLRDLSRIQDKIGMKIPQGTPLGYIDDTGLPPPNEHLHFEMYYCDPNKDCTNETNKYLQRPEPLEGHENFSNNDELPSTIMGLGLKNTNAKTEGIVYLSRNGTVYTTSLFQIPIKNMEDNINCLVPAWVLLRNTKTPIIYTRNLENSFLILILLIIRLAQPFWNQMASRT
jgi:murein DD-endopeptidase MepM/ murein hydrolase activator NlpD